MALERPKPRGGVYEKPFWKFLAKRELRLQTCTACGHVRYPPGPVCPRCLSDGYEWTPVSGRGRIVSWTVFHRQYLPQMPVPYTVISVALEEGPLMIGNIDAPADALKLDMPVALIFEDVASPEGDWVIPQWRRV
jgi:uncharacterized OB-fold protein